MRRAALKIAESQTQSRDDQAAMSDALARLYRTATHNIGDVTASLTPSERAKLAVFCYGRAHLNAVGLAIAANCDLDHLIAASNSATAGQTLYMQSREAAAPADKSASRRPTITLASSVPNRFSVLAGYDLAELPA
jgi:hypothetical protein